MTTIIDGKKIAEGIRNEVKLKSKILFEEKGIIPGLALLLVGENPSSMVYVNSKEKACKEVGFYSIVKKVSEDISEKEVLDIVHQWNIDDKIHGILVQLPLPKHIDEHKVIQTIFPSKDVDGFHPENIGRLVIGLPGFVPCTPAGIFELLIRSNISVSGKHVVIVGRSNIVGKPIANLLYQKNPNANGIVTICHSGAKNFREYTRQADILIAAMGVPFAIKSVDVKEGAVIIDVGINRIEDKNLSKGYRLVGDVDFESVKDKVSAITPVPGGVGPMTISMLLANTYKSAEGGFFNAK